MAASIVHLKIFKHLQLPQFSTDLNETGIKMVSKTLSHKIYLGLGSQSPFIAKTCLMQYIAIFHGCQDIYF